MGAATHNTELVILSGLNPKVGKIQERPGNGKSTLPGVWISLDEGDSYLRIFMSYVVATVRCLDSNSCTRKDDLLDAPRLSLPDILVKLLANDLEEIAFSHESGLYL